MVTNCVQDQTTWHARECDMNRKRRSGGRRGVSMTSALGRRLSGRSMWERDYTAHCHYLFSLKQCGINMIIQERSPYRFCPAGGCQEAQKRNNAFDIFIKVHVVSGRHNRELLRDHKVVFEGPNAEGKRAADAEKSSVPAQLTFPGMQTNHERRALFTPAGGRAEERAAETVPAPPE